ncbi:MAG TPA: hypothetical protein VNW92_28680 [Polyangiaceae bacterium]|nr:hypothetical protein [Polyangiaceae bacterium]
MQRTRRIPRSVGTLALLACGLALSCGNRAVELSTPPRLEPSTEPTTLGSINEHVGSLAVDDHRLYWTGAFAGYNERTGETGVALHSCEKDRCAESVVTYDSSRVENSGFGVHDGAIYWTVVTSLETLSRDIISCATTGCTGAPRVFYTDPINGASLLAYGSDAIYFYDSASQIERMPYSGSAQPQSVAATVDYPQNLAINGDYLYVLESSSTDRGIILQRTRTDGSTQLETLAEQLKILGTTAVSDGYDGPPRYANLAFDAMYVYWTSNTLTGSIQRCPLTGCVGSPETLTAPIRAPTTLRLDGGKAYFQYYDVSLGNTLTSCTLPHCEPSTPIAHGLDDWNVIAIDDRYVYTASTDQMPSPELLWDFPSAQIRRFAK